MSYMRVPRGRWPDLAVPDSDVGRQVLQDVFEAVRGLPGNQSYVAGVDRASGRRLTVSTWDTEEDARRDNLSGSDLASRVQALGVQGDPPEFFEVTTPA
jgi:hypothetical protein